MKNSQCFLWLLINNRPFERQQTCYCSRAAGNALPAAGWRDRPEEDESRAWHQQGLTTAGWGGVGGSGDQTQRSPSIVDECRRLQLEQISLSARRRPLWPKADGHRQEIVPDSQRMKREAVHSVSVLLSCDTSGLIVRKVHKHKFTVSSAADCRSVY